MIRRRNEISPDERPDADRLLEQGRRVLAMEADAIRELGPRLGPTFVEACRLCLACRGRIVVTGMGKSGHVGGKIAATLASTGSPSFFVHPGEASHGDMGMITGEDAVLAVSNSGDTVEIVTLLPLIKRLGVPLITLTGKPDSVLARAATVNVDVSVSEEACPLNLAPTASTTAALAMGDALAIAMLDSRGFTVEDFARSHPGGMLGRRLLLKVEDVMHTGDEIPRVAADIPVGEGLVEMSRKGLGMTAVVDADGRLLGIFTDGDLRRALDHELDVHRTLMREVMTRDCRTIGPQELAAEAVHLLDACKINQLLVVGPNRELVGALNVHDLLRAGVM
ncbi:KpsF/GutQ family sugar-phosphate isomerase [soil metagenome]